MRKFVLLLVISLFSINSLSCYAFSFRSKDARKNEAKYIYNVLKQEEKDSYQKKVLNRKPSGYMTVEEYEALSEYKDKSNSNVPVPNLNRSDMKYVPKPTYKIVRYNDPPGSTELSISKSFYQLRQYNGQGITSPDYSIMAYPVVYYYPNSASTASDIFVIHLEQNATPLEKILKANVVKRGANPIISTEKSIDNSTAFRSLTPVDFSFDGTKLLVKEKIGSSQDGIWKTNAIVYDFSTKTSYNLLELRDSIIYYWKEFKHLNLDESRWDIYPLGFDKKSPYRVIAYGYAYTGAKPVFLGLWSIDCHGEQSRLESFNINEVEVSANGFKLVQDGVVNPVILKTEQKALKQAEKLDSKALKRKDKQELKAMKKEYNKKIKEMKYELKDKTKDYNTLQSIDGSTIMNDIPDKYRKIRAKQLKNEIKQEENTIKRMQKAIDKIDKIKLNE